jgi:hypothetical protein
MLAPQPLVKAASGVVISLPVTVAAVEQRGELGACI